MTDANGTARYLVLFDEDATEEGARRMIQVAGLRAVAEEESGPGALFLPPDGTDGVFWTDLGVALVTAGPDQLDALTRTLGEHGPIVMVEPERRVFAIGAPAPSPPADDAPAVAATWGLRAVGATESKATGAGVRVAVLDTGFDLAHPDYAGRAIVTSSFIEGEDVADGHGHGTHVIGSACGPREPAEGPGYGVAYQSEIYAGKVLGNDGSGTDGGILAGIAWAIRNNCAIVSMSLGAPSLPGQPHSVTFERAARRAMDKGTLVIAAAGNDSRRSAGRIAPVGHPANCPTIMAVGAVDEALNIADFSCGSVDPAGAVDVVGPGVAVHSSWPTPERYKTISGTSMATPHVAGIAALTAQTHQSSAWELWARLTQSARRLPLPSTDVGAGLVRAP